MGTFESEHGEQEYQLSAGERQYEHLVVCDSINFESDNTNFWEFPKYLQIIIMADQQATPTDSSLPSDILIVNEINKIMISMGLDKVLPEMQKCMSLFEDIQQEQVKTKQSVFELKAENYELKARLDYLESRVLGVEKIKRI